MERRVFRAMGTEVELLLDVEAGADGCEVFAKAESEFHRLEARLSRFQPESELSTLNRLGSLRASAELREVVELALAARERTGGRFDPTVHDALVAAGYDRSFELVPADTVEAAVVAPQPCHGRVLVDRPRGLIALEPGVRLDLGGIGKGYAVDRACAVLAEAGDCLVNAGGDVAVAGGKTWPVGVETGEGALTLALDRGALATTGRDRRRWRRAGAELHHLIDPCTGLPSPSDLLRVTVLARTAVAAEVRAKALFLVGAEVAEAEADAAGTPCVLVTFSGDTVLAGGLA